MVAKLTPSQIAEDQDLRDWRVLLNRIEATFLAPSFTDAAAFAHRIATAADRADHHPDVELRYPGRVHVALTTHTAGGLTERDVSLAKTISSLASEARVQSQPRAAMSIEVGIDALDIDAVRPFWKAVLGYVDEPAPDGGQVAAIVDPHHVGPPFWFQQMDAPRPQRNRLHIDVTVPHDIAEERIAAAIAAGGRLVTDKYARAFWVLADPEGNEACICTWQDRG